jgi:hypothetical protein
MRIGITEEARYASQRDPASRTLYLPASADNFQGRISNNIQAF